MLIEVWSEGYAATGEHGTAIHLGTYKADSFDDAVEMMLEDHPGLKGHHHRSISDDSVHVIWGCKLFNNEKDARKSFG